MGKDNHGISWKHVATNCLHATFDVGVGDQDIRPISNVLFKRLDPAFVESDDHIIAGNCLPEFPKRESARIPYYGYGLTRRKFLKKREWISDQSLRSMCQIQIIELRGQLFPEFEAATNEAATDSASQPLVAGFHYKVRADKAAQTLRSL